MRKPYMKGACGMLTEEPGMEAGSKGGEEAALKGHGLRMIDMARLQELVENADKVGLQVNKAMWIVQTSCDVSY